MTLPDQIHQLVSEMTHHPITGQTKLHELNDELTFIEILMAAEDRYDITVSDAEGQSVVTVDDLIALVGGKIGEVTL